MISLPPSTVRYALVTKDAWFEAKNRMAAATSSGLPLLRKGVVRANSSFVSCDWNALRKGNLDQAFTLALQALQLREEAGFKPYLPLNHLLLRDIYLAKGDTANAQFNTEIASAIASEMGLTTLVSSMPNIRDILPSPER